MPRTFSRGKKITVETLFDFFEHLDEDNEAEFIRAARVKWCPEFPLQEQDIIEPLLNMHQKFLTYNQHLFEFHKSTVVDDFRVHSKLVSVTQELLDFVVGVRLAFPIEGIV